ncbi:MAG: hypothetical protein MUC43_06625 [Pirellula sp.]|jgi:hypothetical protein|nr:hypothetical protein [Pirellula sp.]
MFTNVLQKPVGAMAVLAAAIGGPYAAFETDAGSLVRRVISGGMQQLPPPSEGDPASLGLLNQQNGQQPNTAYYSAPGGSIPNMPINNSGYSASGYGNVGYSMPQQPSYGGQQGQVGNGGYAAAPTSNPNLGFQSWPQPGPNGQNIAATMPQQGNVVYGPATITPLGGNGAFQGVAQTPYANLETRQGPAQVIPGGTNQLWNYTVGVPSLQQLQRQPTAIGGGNVQDLREVLRFDVTPVWLTQRFSRVTTVLSNVQLDGMRVPLITGTQTTDLAGTLTYYFDSRQTVRRINLHGLTGDPSQLANLMVQFYGLKPEQSLGGQLYTYRWNNQVNSVLHLSPAPIVYSGADHSKFVVFLELNQADANMGLSQEASEILNNLQSIRRW